MARRNQKRRRKGKKVYSIIVDGQTEVWYLQMMKQYEDLPKIDIKPELPKRKKLKEQFELVKENAKHYDKVIWLLDFDTILKETREAKKGTETPLQQLKKYVQQLVKYPQVTVLMNTPCLEFWFLLHFENSSRFYPNCMDVEKSLKKEYLADYEKSEHFFKKRDNDIYKRLKSLQPTAYQNGERLGEFDFENPHAAKAETYQLLEILEIVKK